MKVLVNQTSNKIKISSLGIFIRANEEYVIPTISEGLFGTNTEVIGLVSNGTLRVGDGTSVYANAKQGEVFLRNQFGSQAVSADEAGTVRVFDNIVTVDSNTGTIMTTFFYDIMSMARELYNAPDNPLHDPDFVPILGPDGLLDQLTGRVAAVETGEGPQFTRLTALETAYDEAASRLTLLETANDQTATRLTALETADAATVTRFETFDTSYGEVTTRLTTLETAYDETAGRFTTLETAYDETATRLTTLETASNQSASRLTTLEDAYTNNTSQRLTVLEGDATDALTRIAALESDRTADEATLANLQAQVDTNTGNITALQSAGTGGGGGGTSDPALSARVNNLETILGKTGWYTVQERAWTYKRPQDLLIYYGWISSFNSATNFWTPELVAQDMAKYGVIVLGNGLADPSHGDYAAVSVIVPRIKALNPRVKIFGYATANQALGDFQTKADQWNALGAHGVFLDEAGYDYGVSRANFNEKVDYVHGLTNAKLAFANAWNMDDVLGAAVDATHNPSGTASHLTSDDWYLLESFAVNTDAYTGSFAPVGDWASRGVKATQWRNATGINVAAINVIADGHGSAQGLADFAFTSGLMWSLEASGTAESYYGAGSAKTAYYPRLSTEGLTEIYSLGPSVQNDLQNSSVYHRYVGFGRLSVNFASGSESSTITKY